MYGLIPDASLSIAVQACRHSLCQNDNIYTLQCLCRPDHPDVICIYAVAHTMETQSYSTATRRSERLASSALNGIPGSAKVTWHSVNKILSLVSSEFCTTPYFRSSSDKKSAAVNCKKSHRGTFNCNTKQTVCSNLKGNALRLPQMSHRLVSCINYTTVLKWWRLFKADNLITGTRIVHKVVSCSSRSHKCHNYTIYKTKGIS